MTVKGHIRGPQVVLCAEHCCKYVQDAKAQLQHVLSKDPCNGHAWHTLGQMAEETGDLQQAAQCYTDGTQSTGWPSLLQTRTVTFNALVHGPTHESGHVTYEHQRFQILCNSYLLLITESPHQHKRRANGKDRRRCVVY